MIPSRAVLPIHNTGNFCLKTVGCFNLTLNKLEFRETLALYLFE